MKKFKRKESTQSYSLFVIGILLFFFHIISDIAHFHYFHSSFFVSFFVFFFVSFLFPLFTQNLAYKKCRNMFFRTPLKNFSMRYNLRFYVFVRCSLTESVLSSHPHRRIRKKIIIYGKIKF